MESRKYGASFSEVFDPVLQILDELGLRKASVDEKGGRIVASTGLSLWSWGERITIEITKEGPKTRVTVSSTPKAQLFNWGKSRENEKRIIRELNNRFGGQ